MSDKLANINCRIWGITGKVFDGELEMLTYPNSLYGPTTILRNHAPTLGLLKPGEIKYKEAGNSDYKTLPVKEGCVYLENNQLRVFVNA